LFLGKLVLPIVNQAFHINSSKNNFGEFEINGFPLSRFHTFELQPRYNNPNFKCVVGQFNKTLDNIILWPSNCFEEKTVVCRKILIPQLNCSVPDSYNVNYSFDLLLDPNLTTTMDLAVNSKKTELGNLAHQLNKTEAFKALFSTLWYATLPCFDIKGTTAKYNGDRGIFKYCEWKGRAIPCSSIFTTFPTDRGMCCSFNMKAADEIFLGDTYPSLLKELQDSDKNESFTESKKPLWYTKSDEPKSLPGRNKGLVLVIDSHSDLFSAGSLDVDYDSFMGLISPSGSFPLMNQEGFEIQPGHYNVISLSGSKVVADDDLRYLQVSARNCKFPEETVNLRLHKNYTYMNCMLECSMSYAENELIKDNSSNPCVPWYFPSSNNSITVCDPWESVKFYDFMNQVPDDACSDCLPGNNNYF